MSRRPDCGRHRRRRTRLTVPSVVGSVTVAAAASGALVMPSAAGTPNSTDDDTGTLDISGLDRPQGSMSDEDTSAFATVVAAGESLSAKTTERAKEAHEEIVEERAEAAKKEAARKEREAKRWVSPLTSSYRLSAGFGATSSLWSSYHTGIDLATSYGNDVRVVSSGEIIFAGWDGAYGNKIVVRHWDGTETWYGHLSRFVYTSGTVSPGTVIGQVGSTGNSTGPHLHLEVHPYGGAAVNPTPWFEERGLYF